MAPRLETQKSTWHTYRNKQKPCAKGTWQTNMQKPCAHTNTQDRRTHDKPTALQVMCSIRKQHTGQKSTWQTNGTTSHVLQQKTTTYRTEEQMTNQLH